MASSGPYDFGLVKIDRSGGVYGGRWATNKLYREEAKGDYDARVTRVLRSANGMSVVKSGITTDKTVGTITSRRVTGRDGRTTYFRVKSSSVRRFATYGDSGGPVYRSGTNELVGIVSGAATGDNSGATVDNTILIDAANHYGVSIYTSNSGKRLH